MHKSTMWEYFHIVTPLQRASASMHTRVLMFTDTQMQNKQHHLQSDKTINPGQYAASVFGGKKIILKNLTIIAISISIHLILLIR